MITHYLYCVILIFWGWYASPTIAVANPSESSSLRSVNTGDPEYLQQGIYLVIGVFTYEDNAESFSQYAQSQGFSAKYAYYPSRGYYYVYTFTADSVFQVAERCLNLRNTSEFEDAWVFRAYEADVATKSQGWDSTDWDTPEINVPLEESDEITVVKAIEYDTMAAELVTPPVTKLPQKREKTEPGYDVFFRTLGENNQAVTAVVKVVDGSHAKSIKQCQSNQPEVLEHSRLLTEQVQLITYAIGYRKASFDLPLDEPVNDSTASYVSVNDEVINVEDALRKA